MVNTQPVNALRPAKAAAYIGVCESTLWNYTKRFPDFPKARRLTSRCTIFFADELDSWLKTQGERTRIAA